MNAWYVGVTAEFINGIGPTEPNDEDIVLVFLTQEEAENYIEDNNLQGIALIHPITVTEGHGSPPLQPSIFVTPWIFGVDKPFDRNPAVRNSVHFLKNQKKFDPIQYGGVGERLNPPAC